MLAYEPEYRCGSVEKLGKALWLEASSETLLLTLKEKQARFAYMVSQLILFAYFNGMELTLGGAYATTGHSKQFAL